jgi:TonB family protein
MNRIYVGFLLVVAILLAGCTTERERADQAYMNHDYKTAIADYKDLAESGDAFGDSRLAYMYSLGLGVEVDTAEGERWFEKAALDGDAGAAALLASHYLPPNPVDYARAFKWFKVGADRYDLYCELETSIFYENGMGIPRDHDEAEHWLNMFVGKTHVSGAPIQYKYQGADNIGGFMVAMEWALFYSPYYKDTSRYAGSNPVWLGFDIKDGHAVDVHVVKSSGKPEADAAAVDAWQKTPLPPVLSSLQVVQHFTIEFDFGLLGPTAAQI